MRDAAGHELEEVVVAPADEVAFDHLVHLPDAGLESREVLHVVVAQRDLGEDRDGLAELRDVDMRVVPDDVPRLLKALHADEAGAWREAHGLRQLDVRDAPVALQVRQDVDIDAIELHGFRHEDLENSDSTRLFGTILRAREGKRQNNLSRPDYLGLMTNPSSVTAEP